MEKVFINLIGGNSSIGTIRGFISSEKINDGVGKFITVKVEPSQDISEIKAGLKINQQIESSKSNIEFSRYKQDCRKRALEMAHNEFITGNMQHNKAKNADASKDCEYDIMAMSDKYYNWLISIPE